MKAGTLVDALRMDVTVERSLSLGWVEERSGRVCDITGERQEGC